MSHANGKIRFVSDGAILHYEYDGTSDIALPLLHKTEESVNENWRRGKWETCVCGNPDESVEIYSDYGGGFYWFGRGCRNCSVITSGHSPYEEGRKINNGRPSWAKADCKSCGGNTIYDPVKYAGGTYCPNPTCPAYQNI